MMKTVMRMGKMTSKQFRISLVRPVNIFFFHACLMSTLCLPMLFHESLCIFITALSDLQDTELLISIYTSLVHLSSI
jgi:hypothetical protein